MCEREKERRRGRLKDRELQGRSENNKEIASDRQTNRQRAKGRDN